LDPKKRTFYNTYLQNKEVLCRLFNEIDEKTREIDQLNDNVGESLNQVLVEWVDEPVDFVDHVRLVNIVPKAQWAVKSLKIVLLDQKRVEIDQIFLKNKESPVKFSLHIL